MNIFNFLPFFGILIYFIIIGAIIIGIIFTIRYFKKKNSEENLDKEKKKEVPKQKTSFGTIVAVFGSVLIALGFAWLIAQNWHYFNKPIKIIILVFVTSLSYGIAVFLREKTYNKIATALFLLGGFLYSLSVFLIAQLFFTPSGLQGTAWLWLVCFLGVLIAGYIFNSKILLIISAIEFIIWSFYQSGAFFSLRGFSGSNYRSILVFFFEATSIITAINYFAYISNKSRKFLYFLIGGLISLIIYFLCLFIFNSFTLNGVAIIVLISMTIFILSSYISESSPGIFLSFIYFLLWLNIQFVGVVEKSNKSIIPVSFAFLFLFSGILFYGIGLWHRYKEHKFAEAFKWWSCFYFLLFFYLLSFQSIIPVLWSTTSEIAGSQIIFLSILGLVSLIALASGIFISVENDLISKKEILVVLGVILVLVSLLFLTKLSSNLVGTCYQKTCYDFKDQNSCQDTPLSFGCEWKINPINPNNPNTPLGYCQQVSCFSLVDIASCNEYPQIGCKWENENNRCSVDYNYREATNPCDQYNNQHSSCISHSECRWNASSNLRSRIQDIPGIILFTWIIINIFFIIFILLIIGYGSSEKLTPIINLGILAFVIDILTRYIGFVSDLWGYNLMALIFISGGILLIAGGWGVERWRRKLIKNARGEESQIPNKKIK